MLGCEATDCTGGRPIFWGRIKRAETPAQWAVFTKKYRSEMASPEASHALELFAALSHTCSFSVGCYCDDEAHCHRSVLRGRLADKGAKVAWRYHLP